MIIFQLTCTFSSHAGRVVISTLANCLHALSKLRKIYIINLHKLKNGSLKFV